MDEEHGSFFVIRAGKGTDMSPEKYSYYVSEVGYSPRKLDFNIRTYDINGTPIGGDRNGTYEWTMEGDLWSDGEGIAFDMPIVDMEIEVIDGAIYEVFIKNSKGEMFFKDTFDYIEQENVEIS